MGVPTKGATLIIIEGNISTVYGVDSFLYHDMNKKQKKPYLIPNASDALNGKKKEIIQTKISSL